MKCIKNKNKQKPKRIVEKISFWTIVVCFTITIIGSLVAVFTSGSVEQKIAVSATCAIVTPMFVLYSIIVYDKECRVWKPLSD